MSLEFEIRKLEAEERRRNSADGESDQSYDSGFKNVGKADRAATDAERPTDSDIQRDNLQSGRNIAAGRKRRSGEAEDSNRVSSEIRVRKDGEKYLRPDGSLIKTGWETERAVWLSDEQSVGIDFGNQEETTTAADWNSYGGTSAVLNGLYFAGNLSQMIENPKHKPRRIHGKLSQREKEKKLAHGQKIDDVGWEQSM